MASRREKVVLHGPFTERRRISKRGKVSKRVSIDIESTPIVHDFDEMRLGQGPAEAIRDVIGDQIKGINRQVSPSTVARRERFLISRDNPTYNKRFNAPRTKAGTIRKGSVDSTPDRGNIHKWGYFSGRLADGLFVRQNPVNKTFTINVPKNRLDETTFGRGFMRFIQMLEAEVPAIRDPAELLRSPKVRAAVNKSINDLITSGLEKRAADKLRQLRQARARIVGQIVRSFL